MRLCVFIHYHQGSIIPYFVTYYLSELSNHFDQIILVTNKRDMQESVSSIPENVSLLFVENQGYDFGMFYKALQTVDLDDYLQVACINDSNVLFKSLSNVFAWSNSNQVDFWGLVDSNERPWFSTHENNFHIQSFFMVFEKKAILKLKEYLQGLDVNEIFSIQDIKELRRRIINMWEIGLSQFMLKNKMKVGAYINSNEIEKKYKLAKGKNLTHKHYDLLIELGYPLMKRKAMIQNRFWRPLRFINVPQWQTMIRKNGDSTCDIPRLITELTKK